MKFLTSVPDDASIQFPRNACYGQDQTIVLRDRKGLVVDGNGSTFKRITPPNPYNPPIPTTNNANWRILRGDGVTLKNMTIRGNYVATPRGSAPAQGQYTDHGISIWAGLNATLVDVSIYDTDGELVGVDPDIETARAQFGGNYAKAAPARNITIDRLRGERAARQCISTTSVDGFVLQNSQVSDCQQTGFDAEIDVEGELNRNIRILNNTFSGTYFGAIQVPVLSFPGFEGTVGRIEIRGNTMTQASDTCFPSILIGDGRGGAEDVTIADNVLLTIGDGIQFSGMTAGSIGGSVSKNTIRKTVTNAGCDNDKLVPPHATPIRLNGNSISVTANKFQGFCCEQDVS